MDRSVKIKRHLKHPIFKLQNKWTDPSEKKKMSSLIICNGNVMRSLYQYRQRSEKENTKNLIG